MNKDSGTMFSVDVAPGGPTEKLYREKRLPRQPNLNGSRHGNKPLVGNPERNGSFHSTSGVSSTQFMGGAAFNSASGRRVKSNEGKLKLFRSNEFTDGTNGDSTQQFNEYIDTDKQKVMEHFTKSMEELTRRQRKLDHLQRCLKRYEIERAEAGQAVCRIEQRLKELQERTSDLLRPGNYLQKCGEFLLDLPAQNRFGAGLVGYHTGGGKNRLKVDVRTNQLYIDSQVMLDSDQTNLSPINESDSTETSRRRSDKTAGFFDRWVPGDLDEGDSEFSEVRELQARYKMLTEHLNVQRSRLAVADATVAKLARTLMKFSIMTPEQRSPNHRRTIRNGRNPIDSSAIFHKRLSYTEFTSPTMLPYCSVPNNTHEHHFYSLPNSSTLSPKNRQIRTTQQLRELAWVDQLTSAFQPRSTTLATPNCWNPEPLEPIPVAMIAPVVNTSLSYSDSSQLSRKSPFRSIAMQIEKDQKLFPVQQPPRRQTDGEYIFLTNTDSAFVPWNNTPILERPVGHRPYQPFLSVPPLHYRRSFHLPGHSDCEISVPHRYSEAPVQPPPLPPKPSRHNFLSDADNDVEPASMEDEEVSKFMTLSKDSWEQISVKEQDMLALSSLPISARPPPPPYYVNIFHESANPSTTVARSAAQSQEFVQTRMMSDGVLCPNTTHADRKPTNGVAIKPTREEIRPQENCATECSKPVQRRYIRPNLANSVNLRVQLEQMGYPLHELTMREESSESLLRAQISTSRCLPFMLALWLRPGMRRSFRDKNRSQSADDSRDHVRPFSMTMKSEFRVVLTETSCEGRLWIQQQASSNLRHRFWDNFRGSQRRATTQPCVPPPATSTAASKVCPSRRELPDNWILRWFVCDLRHQTFTSYERQRDEKPKDFIYLSDVRAIKSSPENDVNSKAPEGGSANSPRKLSLESNDNRLVLEDAITRDLDELSEKSKANEMRRKRLSLFHRVNRLDSDNNCSPGNSIMEATFQIETTDSRVYTLKAASKHLRKLWTAVLHIAVDQQRKQTNV